jgi:hypothetical protein
MSSDTPQVVCLHDFANYQPLRASDQSKRPPENPDMPTNCGSPVWAHLRGVRPAAGPDPTVAELPAVPRLEAIPSTKQMELAWLLFLT